VPPDVHGTSRSPLSFRKVSSQRFIVHRSESLYRKRFKRVLLEKNVEIADIIEAGNCLTAYGLAEVGFGLAFVHSVCLQSPKNSGLRQIDITQYTGQDDIAIITARNNKLVAHQLALRDYLIAAQL